MIKRTQIFMAMSLSMAVAGAACSSNRNSAGGDAGNRASGDRDQVTVAGCLSGGPEGRMVLTAAPDPGVTTAARPGMGERDTYSYVLVGGNNLQQHIGKRVEVSGTIAGRKQEMERETKNESQSPAATGTSGRDTPTVETKEAVDLEARQLNVNNIRELAPNCKLNP